MPPVSHRLRGPRCFGLYIGLASPPVISATGINVCLARRKRATVLDDVWAGCLWGLPLGIVAAAVAQVLLGIAGLPVLRATVLASAVYASVRWDPVQSRRALKAVCGLACLVLASGHAARFGTDAFRGFALPVNGFLVVTGGILLGSAVRLRSMANERMLTQQRL